MPALRLLAAVAVAAGLLAVPASSAAPLPPPVALQPCGGTSWWAGTTNVCDGRVVYRDYVNDDLGADTGGTGYEQGTQNAFGTLAHPAGDVRYPAGRISSADLVRLELSRVGNRIDVVAETAALYTAGDTVLTLAVDTDGNPGTGGGAWGDLAVSSTGWDRLVRVSKGDPRTNTLRGSFPLPKAARWRVQAVTSQAATGEVMNVAFRGVQEQAQYTLDYANASANPPSGQGAWFEDQQARFLAAGDISTFGQVVRTADLRKGVQRLHRIAPGLHERVYTSRYTVPGDSESMSYKGVKGRGDGGSATAFAQVFNLLGKYLPYGVYVPKAGSRPYGLQMEWHGSNQGIVAQINQPGMQKQFGEDLGRLLVAPSARGPNGYGSDSSERDLLDVMDDVQKALPVDRSRVFSSGYSQGGYLTFRMAMLFPDRFAGFSGWVPFTGNDTNGTPAAGTVDVTAGAVGNMRDFVGNARHVPGTMVFGAQDELVQVPSAEDIREQFAATDNAYRWWMHNPAEHLTFAALDEWGKEAAYSRDLRLVRNPGRVTFRTASFLDSPAYGVRHDRAYWVRDLRPRGEGVADTDLTSAGCGAPVTTTTAVTSAGTVPVPYVEDGQDATTTRGARAATLTGTLSGVGSLTVDVAGACLTGAVRYAVRSDGPATLTLSDGRALRLVAGMNEGVRSAP